jgi:hypothetical protein
MSAFDLEGEWRARPAAPPRTSSTGQEQTRVHRLPVAEDGSEVHLRQAVPLDADARRYLGQFAPSRCPPQHASLGHVQDGLPDLADELAQAALAQNAEFAVLDGYLPERWR